MLFLRDIKPMTTNARWFPNHLLLTVLLYHPQYFDLRKINNLKGVQTSVHPWSPDHVVPK